MDCRPAIYIAARDLERAKAMKVKVEALGFICCARWITEADPEKFGKGYEYTDDERETQALLCVADVADCDILVHLGDSGVMGKGGRHVELGMALADVTRCIHVGPRENVFHWHPDVKCVERDEGALEILAVEIEEW